MIRLIQENWFRWVPLAALAVLGFLILPICVSLALVTDDPDEAYDSYSELQERIKHEEGLLKAREKEQKGAFRELNDIDKDIIYLNQRIESIEHRLHAKNVQLKNLDKQLDVAAGDMAQALAAFETRLVEWYKTGTQQDVEFLLMAEDLSDFIYRLYYSQVILEEDRAIIEEIRAQKTELFEARDSVGKEIDVIKSLKTDLSESRSDYKGLYDKKRYILDNISKDVEEIEEAINEMERVSNEIASYLRGVEGSAFYPVAGRFDGTLSKPINASVGSGFGMRIHPILHRRKMHTGVDFPAPTGTSIKAAGGGKVLKAGWMSGYGKTLLIDHGGGLATLYAHCSSLIVSEGDFVMEGQVIAKVGSTGFSTGPHLHFEVRKNGEPKNPMNWIR